MSILALLDDHSNLGLSPCSLGNNNCQALMKTTRNRSVAPSHNEGIINESRQTEVFSILLFEFGLDILYHFYKWIMLVFGHMPLIERAIRSALMTKGLKRRDFINKSFQVGISSFLGSELMPSFRGGHMFASNVPHIVAVEGEGYLDSTYKAIGLWGGMGKVVSRNSRVAILPNSQSKHPGAFTKPEIVRATIRMIKEAGAKEVNCLSWLSERNWEATGLAKVLAEEGAQLKIIDPKDETLFSPISIPHGKVLKEARLMTILSEHDVLVNMPIMKDHVGNKFTGTMKNLMGLNSPRLNQFFHSGNNDKPDNIEHLDQCIADLNTVCSPTLCIVDSTEFISNNGPFGPGKVISPKKVVVGTDRVAIDSYCVSLLGMKGEDIFMIKQGHEHGLGEINLKRVKIQEVRL